MGGAQVWARGGLAEGTRAPRLAVASAVMAHAVATAVVGARTFRAADAVPAAVALALARRRTAHAVPGAISSARARVKRAIGSVSAVEALALAKQASAMA